MLFKKNITLHKTINEVILEEYDKKDKVLKNKIILQDNYNFLPCLTKTVAKGII